MEEQNTNENTHNYANNESQDTLPAVKNEEQSQILQDNCQHGRFKRLTIQNPSSGMVTNLQFDDDKIVASLDDGGIYIYETKTGKHISTLTGHDGGIWALDYIGNTLVTGSTDCTVRVWDIARAVCAHVFRGHISTIRCLKIIMPTMIDGQFQPSQPVIVTASRDCTLRVWRLPDQSTDDVPPFDAHDDEENPWLIHTLTGHDSSVRTFAVHGNTLISGSYDHTLIVWNLETGQFIHRLKGHELNVYAVVMDPERKQCYSSSLDGSVCIWNYVTGECLHTLKDHGTLVGHLRLTPNYLISAGADAVIRIWDPVTGECRHVLSGHNGVVTCISNDEHKIISGAKDGLKMWDIKTGSYIQNLISDHVSRTWSVAFNNHRCVVAFDKLNDNDRVTCFEILDFSVEE